MLFRALLRVIKGNDFTKGWVGKDLLSFHDLVLTDLLNLITFTGPLI